MKMPVNTEEKRKLNKQGFKVVDERFDPEPKPKKPKKSKVAKKVAEQYNGGISPFYVVIMAYLPIDLMTSELRNSRRLKVTDDNLVTVIELMMLANVQSESQNNSIINELKLLNARFEEAFNTGLEEKDCETLRSF